MNDDARPWFPAFVKNVAANLSELTDRTSARGWRSGIRWRFLGGTADCGVRRKIERRSPADGEPTARRFFFCQNKLNLRRVSEFFRHSGSARSHLIDNSILGASAFDTPRVLLAGPVDYDMYRSFRDQLSAAPSTGLVVVELSTLGGDPEVARMMGEDVRFHSDIGVERRFVFLGKAAIYSAGATFMSFFATCNRYLTRGARLMIHERKLDKRLHISGPLTTCVPEVEALLHELQHSIAIQNEGFENLIRGSKVTMEEVLQRASSNWYLEAQEALELNLIAGVI